VALERDASQLTYEKNIVSTRKNFERVFWRNTKDHAGKGNAVFSGEKELKLLVGKKR